MEFILSLVAFYGGIYFIGWFVGKIEEWNENKKSKIRDKVANELLEKKETVTEVIEECKKKLIEIGYNSKEEYRSLYNYFHKKRRYDELLGQCPQCNNGYLRIIDGKYGKFIGCSSFPSCNFTLNIDKAKEKYKKEIMTDIISSIQRAYQ